MSRRSLFDYSSCTDAGYVKPECYPTLLSSQIMRLTFLDDSDVTRFHLVQIAIINKATTFNHNLLIIFIVSNFFYTVSPDSPLACSGRGWGMRLYIHTHTHTHMPMNTQTIRQVLTFIIKILLCPV